MSPIEPEDVYNLKDYFVNLAIENNERTRGTAVLLPTPTGMESRNIKKDFDIQYTYILIDEDMTSILELNYCCLYIQKYASAHSVDGPLDDTANLQECLYMLLLYFHYDTVHYAAHKNGINFYVDSDEEMFTARDIEITKL